MQLMLIPSSGKAVRIVPLQSRFFVWLVLSIMLSIIVASIALYVVLWQSQAWEKVLPAQWVRSLRVEPRFSLSSYELVAFGQKLAHLTASVSYIDETTTKMIGLLAIDLQSIDQRAMDNDFSTTMATPVSNGSVRAP